MEGVETTDYFHRLSNHDFIGGLHVVLIEDFNYDTVHYSQR